MSRTALFVTNGGLGGEDMGFSPWRITGGWPAEFAKQLAHLTPGLPDEIIWHLPHGFPWHPYPFDALVYARARGFAKAVNADDMAVAMLIAQAMGVQRQWAYYGGLEHSPVFNTAWARGNIAGIDQRIDTCLAPMLRARDRGVNIGVWEDASAIRDKNSLTAHGFARIHEHHGLPYGAEARLTFDAEWLNRKDVPVLAWREDWHSQAKWPGIIPEDKLLGPRWVICRTRAEVQAERKAGRNVACVGHLWN